VLKSQAVAEKTAKNFLGVHFLQHPVQLQQQLLLLFVF